jgi:hypothetical protein
MLPKKIRKIKTHLLKQVGQLRCSFSIVIQVQECDASKDSFFF